MAAQLRGGQRREDGITRTKVAPLVAKYNRLEESKHQVSDTNASSYIARQEGRRHGGSSVVVSVIRLFNRLSLEANISSTSTSHSRPARAGGEAVGDLQAHSPGDPARSSLGNSHHRALQNKTDKHTGNLHKRSAEKDASVIVTGDAGKTWKRHTSQPVENSTIQHEENAASLPGENDASQFVESETSTSMNKTASQKTGSPVSQTVRQPVSSLVLDYGIKRLGPVAERGINWALDSNHPFALCFRPLGVAWRSLRNVLFWLPAEPLWRSLQTSHVAAAGECPTCSPLGRLSVLHYNQSGSSIEGLDDLDGDPKRECSSDIDIMIELGPCRWIEPEGPGNQPVSTDPVPDGRAPPLLMAMPSENPGFVLLFVEPTAECDHEERRQFSAAAVRQLVQDWCTARHSPDVIIETPGPAVNVSRKGATNGGTDWVACLRMPVWPGEEEFRSRQRVTDFPPAEAREDIVRFGVHLVPTGHPDSGNELIEFRLSFSRAELVAGWHLFSTVRVAVKGLKNVRNVMKKRRKKTTDTQIGKQLKSYHIKTAALWLCQDTPREQWTSPIKAMHMILDKLEEAVKTRTLLCFFWTEINLLAGFSEEDFQAMGRQIVKIRKSMLLHLVSWFSTVFDVESWLKNDMSELLQMAPENRQRQTESIQKPTRSAEPLSRRQHSFSGSQRLSSVNQQPSTESLQPSSASQQPSSESQQPSSESQQPPSESQQPSSESQQPSSESQQPSSESQQPSSESQQPSSESQQPSSESQQPSSESQQPSSESQKPSSESHQPSSESEQPSSESQQPSSESQKPSSESQQPSSESEQPSSESQQPSSESQQPSSESEQPSSESQQPSSESQQPSSESQQPSSESQQPSSESQQPSTEGQQPSSESQQPSSESQQPYSESQQPSSESQQPSSESQQPSSESQKPSSESQQPSSESEQPPSENQQPSSESQQPSSDSQQPSSESQQPSSESQQPSSESQQPSSESQQPSSESQQPSSESQQPSSESQQPSSESQQPSSQSQQPSTEGQQPSSESQQPSSDSQQSSSDSQQPSSDSQQPSSDSQQSSSESQQPSSESQQPSSESQQPSSESQKPSSESHQPSSESQQPSSESEQPSSESQQPSSESQEPSSESQQPSSESQQPSSESQKPSSESQQPSSESQQPSSESQQPSSESQQPSSESQQPSSESQQPSSESQQPSSESQQPSSESQQPSSESQQPSSESQQPSSESKWLESSTRTMRCFVARRLTIWAVMQGVMVRPGGPVSARHLEMVPALLYRSAETELEYYSHNNLLVNEVHRILLQAMLVAPDDLVGSARLTSHGGDVYTWDVAPLLNMLTDSDMKLVLGNPEAVADWCRQQLRLPPEERLEGLTADLSTSRGRKELLLHPDLLVRAYEETGSKPFFEKKLNQPGSWWQLPSYQQVRKELEDDLRCDMESRLRRSPNLSEPMVASAARNWKMAIRRLLSGEKLRTEYDALVNTLPDRWQLRQYGNSDYY